MELVLIQIKCKFVENETKVKRVKVPLRLREKWTIKTDTKYNSGTTATSHTQRPVIPCSFLVFEVKTFKQHL